MITTTGISIQFGDKPLFENVSIRFGEPQPYVTLPQTAISYNPYGNMVYVEYSCEIPNAGNGVLRRKMMPITGPKPANAPGQVLIDTVQANPGGTPCFIYQRNTAAGQTFITNVAVTLTVATVNVNRNTGVVEQETKALLNVAPRNVFNVWQLAALGITVRTGMRVLGRDFALSEQTAFVAGSGAGQPKGFTSYATAATADSSRTWGTLEHIATGTSGGFGTTSNGVDKITDMVYKLKSGYRQNACFVMSKQTLGTLRQLKASSGDYIWAPSVIAGSQQWTPSRLLGYSVVEAEDMPAIAANSLSIAFGDFSAGYVIVDRSGMSVLRDPYSNAPYVTFRTVRRVGGGVVDFDAIKLLKFA